MEKKRKKIRTVDKILCSRNNADRGVIFNATIDASLYARGDGTGTEASNRGATLTQRRIE